MAGNAYDLHHMRFIHAGCTPGPILPKRCSTGSLLYGILVDFTILDNQHEIFVIVLHYLQIL